MSDLIIVLIYIVEILICLIVLVGLLNLLIASFRDVVSRFRR